MTTATINENLLAVDCIPWCEHGAGHTNVWHPADQWCYGPRHVVELTNMPLQHYTAKGGTESCAWLRWATGCRAHDEARRASSAGAGSAPTSMWGWLNPGLWAYLLNTERPIGGGPDFREDAPCLVGGDSRARQGA